MTQQTVDWAQCSPDMSRLFWRKFFYEMKGTGVVLALLALLSILDLAFLKMSYVWMMFLGVLFFYLCITAFGYFSTHKFYKDVGQTVYSLDETSLNVKHRLAKVSIPIQNISKVVTFPEGIYVQYGPRLMMTLPNGPVQAELSQKWRGGAK